MKDAAKLTLQSQFCYDPGLAKDFNVKGREGDPGQCGSKRPARPGQFEFQGAGGRRVSLSGIEPVVRSPIGVFRYLGRLLNPAVGSRVRLLTRTPGIYGQPLLDVRGAGGNCFAEASSGGPSYCVPSEGASPTKEDFAVLATLIALHTKRSDLPPPSTLLIVP